MTKRKLSDEQIDNLIAEYREWNPHDPDETRTVDDIARAYGISRQTLYNYVEARKRNRDGLGAVREAQELRRQLEEANEAIRFLTRELMAAKAELALLKEPHPD